MKRVLLIVSAICLGAAAALVQGKSLPRFEDFPAREKFMRKPAPVRLLGRKARTFRTALRRGAAAGPNFAGHYTVATWGCGTFMCTGFAIINARTGDVYFPPKIQNVSLAWLDQEEQVPMKYKRNSRLLVLIGEVMFDDGSTKKGKYFYLWQNNKLKLIRSAKI